MIPTDEQSQLKFF